MAVSEDPGEPTGFMIPISRKLNDFILPENMTVI
jgi:hypothetical protein